MNRKIIAGVTLGMLVIAFGAVSLLVFLSKRHPFFVEKKLKLGALLLSLSGVAAGCGLGCTSCYVPVPVNQITIDFDHYDNSTGKCTIALTDTITGAISYRCDTALSYMITDYSGSVFHKDDIIPADGIFDESIEEFAIVLPESISPGSYQLAIAPVPKDSIETSEYYRQSFDLTITE